MYMRTKMPHPMNGRLPACDSEGMRERKCVCAATGAKDVYEDELEDRNRSK